MKNLVAFLLLFGAWALEAKAQKYEAEDATLSGGALKTACASCSGGNMVQTQEGSLSISFTTVAMGYVDIYINASTSTGSKTNILDIDGITTEFTTTNTAYSREKLLSTQKLNAGTHTMKITKSWGWINVDYLELVAVSPPQIDITISIPNNQTKFNYYEVLTINADVQIGTTIVGSDQGIGFFDGNTLLGTDNTSPYSLTTSNLAAGTHTINAKWGTISTGQLTGASYFSNNLTVEIIDSVVDIPDTNFLKKVLTYDSNSDGKIQKSEVSSVTSLDIQGLLIPESNIKSLKGIEAFVALERLDCAYNDLTYLDVSKNTALKYLDCSKNKLASLDVIRNTALTNLSCRSNQLTSLDLSKNTAITDLSCSENPLSTLLVGNPSIIKLLSFSNTKINTFDFSVYPSLEWLAFDENGFVNVDLRQCTKLTHVWCERNQLKELDLSQSRKLYWLIANQNPLVKLNLVTDTLGVLQIDSCQLQTLNMSNCKITGFGCKGNPLSEVKLGIQPRMSYISLPNNQLKTLDVSGCPKLGYLDVSNNQLASLDVSKNTALVDLDCSRNVLEVLNLGANTKLKSVIAVRNPALKNICINRSHLPLLELDSIYPFKITDTVGIGSWLKGKKYSIKDSILTYKLWQKDSSAVWNTKCEGEILYLITYTKPVCQRANLQLTCTKLNGAAYLWRGPNGFSSTEYNPNLFNLNLADSGWYSVRITLPSGDTVSVREKIYVSPSPESISLNSQTPDHCSKDYTMKVESKDTLSYQWFFNAKKMQQAQGMTLQPPLTGVYSVIGYNAQGCGASSLPLYVDVDSNTVPDLIKLRNPARLKASPADKYQWYVDNYFIVNGNQQELPLVYNGSYKVKLTDAKGCVSYSPEYEIFDDNLPSLRTEMVKNGKIELNEFSGLSIVPQPAQDEANITWSSPKRGMVTIELVNASGQIASKTIASKENEVFVYRLAAHDFTSGLYLLRLSCEDKQVTKQMLLSK